MARSEIKVKDNFRKNPKSLEPGGSTIETIDRNGLKLIYDKVKNPKAYISRILRNGDIVSVYVDGVLNWENGQTKV